jgi:hypothetical protein
MLALDFFTADLLNGTKVYVLAVIEHGTRRIGILGATESGLVASSAGSQLVTVRLSHRARPAGQLM